MAMTKSARRKMRAVQKSALGMKDTALAATAGAALAVGNFANAMRHKAADAGSQTVQAIQSTGRNIHDTVTHTKPKSGEVITMKKSTLVGLLVALGAVIGVLGALYVYVLRREKELDEYEQLLFSEEFNDDLPYDDDDDDEAEDAE